MRDLMSVVLVIVHVRPGRHPTVWLDWTKLEDTRSGQTG